MAVEDGCFTQRRITMKKTFFALAIAASLTTGCASIFNGANKPVSIQTDPAGAEFTVTNQTGQVISSGHTPQQVTLANGAGYFKKGNYKIKVSKPGYEDTTADLKPDLSGWYFGNILAGGLIGMLIVDPATGGMYKLPDQTTIPMRKKEEAEVVASNSNSPALPEGAKWQYQAEQLAQISSCSQPSLESIAPGVELYKTNCNENSASIRCEFGHCAVQ